MTKAMTREQTSDNEQTVIITTRGNGFNKKKNELKAFSEKLPKEAELPSVPSSGGLFGLFKYDVTGSDLNRLTESIQDKMIEQNKVLVRTIQEFNTIYDTFSALDKEYIQGILVSLKAAEEANAKALKGIEGVQENQNEIKQIINQQKQVIQVLKNFKEKIEKIEHLADVDKIFAVYTAMQSNVIAIETKVETQKLAVADLNDEMKSLQFSQSVFQDNLNHLKEIQVKQFQTVNQLVTNQNESISKIEVIGTENKTNIETLNNEVAIYGEKIGELKRLFNDDIQILSEKVVRRNSEFDANLDATANEVRKNKTNFETAIKELNVGIEKQTEIMSSYKANIETLNKEVAIQGEKFGDLKRLFQNDIQILSEKVVRNNSEFDAKLDSTTNEVRKNKTNFETAIKELNVGIEKQAERIYSYFESELSRANSEITELSLLTGSLSKLLKTTQLISFVSVAIICVLVILIISGVL